MQTTGTLIRDGGYWIAEIPLFDVASQGRTVRKAVEMALEAAQELSLEYVGVKISLEVLAVSKNQRSFLIALDDSQLASVFSFALRRQRLGRQLSIRQLSRKLGSKSPNSVQNFEYGRHEPSLSKLSRTLSFLGKELRIDFVEKTDDLDRYINDRDKLEPGFRAKVKASEKRRADARKHAS